MFYKILEKQQDHFGIIIQINQIPDYFGNNERTRLLFQIRNSESFDYKNKIIGNLPADDNNSELPLNNIIPLKNLTNFIFNLDFLMINTEIELILKW